MGYLVQNYATTLINNMLNARLNELVQTANPPYILPPLMTMISLLPKPKMPSPVSVCKEDAIENGIATLLRETERARQFGFTETEYNRARAESVANWNLLITSVTNARMKSTSIIVRHFLDNEPIPGIENEYAIINQIAPRHSDCRTEPDDASPRDRQ